MTDESELQFLENYLDLKINKLQLDPKFINEILKIDPVLTVAESVQRAQIIYFPGRKVHGLLVRVENVTDRNEILNHKKNLRPPYFVETVVPGHLRGAAGDLREIGKALRERGVFQRTQVRFNYQCIAQVSGDLGRINHRNLQDIIVFIQTDVLTQSKIKQEDQNPTLTEIPNTKL